MTNILDEDHSMHKWSIRSEHIYRIGIEIKQNKRDMKQTLEKHGFSDVSVWYDQNSLPVDWLSEDKELVSVPPNESAWAEVTWSHPDADIPINGDGYLIRWHGKIGVASSKDPVEPKDPVTPVSANNTDRSWILPAIAFGALAIAVIVSSKYD